MRQKKILTALLIGICALAAAAIAMQAQSKSASRLSEPLRQGEIIKSVYGIGTVTANRSYQFRPGVTSTVTGIFVKEGDLVERGQKLLELDRGVTFTAPFDGTITSLPIKVGENVFPQTVVVEIVDMSDRYIKVSLEQRAAIQVQRGQAARLSFENMRENSFAGTVESVYSSENEFLVRIESPDLPPQILPGMTADVAIGVDRRQNVLLVPVSAIRGESVLVRRGPGGPVSVPIKTGLVDGAVAEVISGNLKPGDQVLLPAKAKT